MREENLAPREMATFGKKTQSLVEAPEAWLLSQSVLSALSQSHRSGGGAKFSPGLRGRGTSPTRERSTVSQHPSQFPFVPCTVQSDLCHSSLALAHPQSDMCTTALSPPQTLDMDKPKRPGASPTPPKDPGLPVPALGNLALANSQINPYQRIQLYHQAYIERLRSLAPSSPYLCANPSSPVISPGSYTFPGPWNTLLRTPGAALANNTLFDPRQLYRLPEEPKPQHSYIGLIAMAILSSNEQKMVLADIYQWILDHYSYFRNRGPGWRNSIRHNLSLNDCFIKAGRSANGKGHYWAIHPANVDDFKKGDFRRRKAQRKVRRHMGLDVPDDEDDSPSPPLHTPPPPCWAGSRTLIPPFGPLFLAATANPPFPLFPQGTSRKRTFDIASLLEPDEEPDVKRGLSELLAQTSGAGEERQSESPLSTPDVMPEGSPSHEDPDSPKDLRWRASPTGSQLLKEPAARSWYQVHLKDDTSD